ncbi:MAG: alpha/beta hydrolase domain-containing protein [Rhodothermales bacterium]
MTLHRTALFLIVNLLLGTGTLNAQIVRLEIRERITPAPENPGYEKLVGRAFGEVDPSDPRNAVITDLTLAPRNEAGRVAYAADFILLKPIDLSRSNGILHYLAPNRGRAIPAPDSVLMAQGVSFLWGAWQGDVPTGGNRLTLDVPIARRADGSPVTGPVRVEFVGLPGPPRPEMPLQGNYFNAGQMAYPPARPDHAGAVLTRRVRETDARQFIPNDRWAFASCDTSTHPFPGIPDEEHVCLEGGFESDYLYELVYEARDPRVLGLGLAAIRDMVTFFRGRTSAAAGDPNPLGASIRFALGAGVSQSGNLMKTFVHLGFNESLDGRRVFEGLFPLVAARQTNINMRFAVPGGGGGVRADHRAFGQSSARGFAPDYHDDIRGTTGGIFTRCAASDTCPKTFLGLSGSELWALQGSPALTDAYGTRDLVQPEDLRIYYFAGTQHGTSPVSWNPAMTVYPAGVESTFDPIVRALWQRLTAWVLDGTPPPSSRVPRVGDGTLVPPEALGYPAMQGVSFPVQGEPQPVPAFAYLARYTSLGLLDFGPRFDEPDESGIADVLPPAYLGKDYAILVAAVDADGNEVAGIQPPGNAAPLGTNLPYSYGARLDLGDLFWLSGTFIPFHETKAGRLAAGDERLSLEERYGDHAGYVEAVRRAVQTLVDQGFMLPDDARRTIAQTESSDVLK